MKAKKKGPTLTDAKGMGGVNAQDGFDYQVWDALARLPSWLKNPAFEGFIVEGLEDVEARFFTPYAPLQRVVDRFQSKSGALSPAAVKDVVKSFLEFDKAHPRHARLQTLVTPQLPAKLKWIERDAGRIRRARPFYAPFPEVVAASDGQFRKDLEKQWGNELGEFFERSVEIALNSVTTLQGARGNFMAALQTEFPELSISLPQVNAIFDALSHAVTTPRGRLISRGDLLKIIADRIGRSLIPAQLLPIHVLSDRSVSQADTLEIDAALFSGTGGTYPPPQKWQDSLVEPLKACAKWAFGQSYRKVYVHGSFRISTAFAIGWSFRAATGFELDVGTNSDRWTTDARPLPWGGQSPWRIEAPSRVSDDQLRVVIGVLREPLKESKAAFAGAREDEILAISLPQPIQNGADAQAFAQAVKSAVATVAGKLGVKSLQLFMATPAAFSVVLGHRWNALPPTQLHEFLAGSNQYVPTVFIE